MTNQDEEIMNLKKEIMNLKEGYEMIKNYINYIMKKLKKDNNIPSWDIENQLPIEVSSIEQLSIHTEDKHKNNKHIYNKQFCYYNAQLINNVSINVLI